MSSHKNYHIETLRGIAILLVVIGHVIGSTPEGGMKIEYPSAWRYLYLWIDYIQMPLFTTIAGWVYATNPVKDNNINNFLEKKIYRLLLPMAVAATLYFLVQYIIPGTNQKGNLADIWKIYVFPYTIYWYLPSLFLMFTIVSIIDRLQLINSRSKWFLCIACFYTILIIQNLFIEGHVSNFFSFMGALTQFPYFIIGVGIYRFSKETYTTDLIKKGCWIFATLGIILLQFEWFFQVKGNILYESLQPICVIALLIILLNQKYSNHLFVQLGSYAYIIYLYHGFGTSGGRILLSQVGINSEISVFLFATTIAIVTPILMGKYIEKSKWLSLLILGINQRK